MDTLLLLAQGLDTLDASKLGVIGLLVIVVGVLWKLWRGAEDKLEKLIEQRDAEQKALIGVYVNASKADESKH